MYLNKFLRNARIYRYFKERGFDYIVNPDTGELHNVKTGRFGGSHQLKIAKLEKFIGLTNMGKIPIHSCQNEKEIAILDLESLDLLCTYSVNKCQFCFPE
jgi:predicted phosphodiesterase